MIRLLVNLLVAVLNTFYREDDGPDLSVQVYRRFFVLETVARVPYFAYLSVLHLYETMGWWRKSDWLKIHFAEAWNELHHLLIAEALGGDRFWLDRLLARAGAFVYYWILVPVYMISPRTAYHFMQLVEEHAYQTYDTFLQKHEAALKAEPAPEVATKYYLEGDMYLFDEFQMSLGLEQRRPQIETLYDVFVAVRDDELEHVKTMIACRQTDAQATFQSPHSAEKLALPEATQVAIAETTQQLVKDSPAEPVEIG
ncbi:plastoquinol terminal oxidase [Trichocoleus sp. FACHB-591]|uniref:alternative oxidase n=1 Tax=Trichocoleus sp. FACHB-591 TaxID=2692872 RepID=UPI00168959CF|nr:alternative oxidase [Trichocoleus sp. FACHB-591]MBD2097851.1 plastoquinol terminal oxidase [Trichocoleus sp. FACHB-591]